MNAIQWNLDRMNCTVYWITVPAEFDLYAYLVYFGNAANYCWKISNTVRPNAYTKGFTHTHINQHKIECYTEATIVAYALATYNTVSIDAVSDLFLFALYLSNAIMYLYSNVPTTRQFLFLYSNAITTNFCDMECHLLKTIITNEIRIRLFFLFFGY